MANRASGKGMLKVLETSDPGFEPAFEELCRRREERDESVDRTVRKIVERVREEGDEEVIAYTRKLDGARIEQIESVRERTASPD